MLLRTIGALIQCDGPIKQYLLHLNRTMNFVIQDLGETELFIQEKYVDIIQEKIEEMLDENAYRAPTEQIAPPGGPPQPS